jgi:hypothetical protein
MKAAFDPRELAGSGLPAAAIEVRRVSVPGYQARCLVMIDCAAAGRPAEV